MEETASPMLGADLKLLVLALVFCGRCFGRIKLPVSLELSVNEKSSALGKLTDFETDSVNEKLFGADGLK